MPTVTLNRNIESFFFNVNFCLSLKILMSTFVNLKYTELNLQK